MKVSRFRPCVRSCFLELSLAILSFWLLSGYYMSTRSTKRQRLTLRDFHQDWVPAEEDETSDFVHAREGSLRRKGNHVRVYVVPVWRNVLRESSLRSNHPSGQLLIVQSLRWTTTAIFTTRRWKPTSWESHSLLPLLKRRRERERKQAEYP